MPIFNTPSTGHWSYTGRSAFRQAAIVRFAFGNYAALLLLTVARGDRIGHDYRRFTLGEEGEAVTSSSCLHHGGWRSLPMRSARLTTPSRLTWEARFGRIIRLRQDNLRWMVLCVDFIPHGKPNTTLEQRHPGKWCRDELLQVTNQSSLYVHPLDRSSEHHIHSLWIHDRKLSLRLSLL
jgi:hypothetical protein